MIAHVRLEDAHGVPFYVVVTGAVLVLETENLSPPVRATLGCRAGWAGRGIPTVAR